MADDDSTPPFVFRYVPSVLRRSAEGKRPTPLRLAVNAEKIFRLMFLIPAVIAVITFCTLMLMVYHTVRKLS